LKVVLDTNVVLDWLVFKDPRIARLRHDLDARAAVILTHPFASNELQRVLAYATLNLSTERQSWALKQYFAHSESVLTPPGFSSDNLLLPKNFPKCRDRDDQFWFAIAYHGKADALISRDQRVLALVDRVATLGVRVLSYAGYTAV